MNLTALKKSYQKKRKKQLKNKNFIKISRKYVIKKPGIFKFQVLYHKMIQLTLKITYHFMIALPQNHFQKQLKQQCHQF
jgi:hypothetical protein